MEWERCLLAMKNVTMKKQQLTKWMVLKLFGCKIYYFFFCFYEIWPAYVLKWFQEVYPSSKRLFKKSDMVYRVLPLLLFVTALLSLSWKEGLKRIQHTHCWLYHKEHSGLERVSTQMQLYCSKCKWGNVLMPS